jgi:hypothetical protein
MATNDQNLTYDNIDRPYNNDMSRSQSDVSAAATGVDPEAGGRTILSGQALTDAWIDTFIKSTNYSPKKVGFLIDGLKGYIEAVSIYLSGSIVGASLDIPDQLSANSFHVDINGNAWWGANTAAGFAGGKASIQNNGIATFGPSAGSRIVINENDLYLYNDLGSPENSASINFLRTDSNPGTFIINKRKSTVNSLGNVMEMFFSDIPAGSVRNYLFFGRSGMAANITDYKTHVISIDPRELIQINTDAVYATGWVSPPGSEIQLFTTAWNPVGYTPFDAGASRIQLGAITGAANNPINWLTGGGGGGVFIGVQTSAGPDYTLIIDKEGGWQIKDFFPIDSNTVNLGSTLYNYLSVHTQAIRMDKLANPDKGWDIDFIPNGGGGFNEGDLMFLPMTNNASDTVRMGMLGQTCNLVVRGNISALTFNGGPLGSGTVTNVGTTGAITGGPITTTGTIAHSTSDGYKHIPSGGTNYYSLRNDASGSASWTRAVYIGFSGVYLDSTGGTILCSQSFNINGTLTKLSGTFRINHPLKPTTHYLQHSFVESPDMLLLYRGKGTIVGGECVITMPDWFAPLNGSNQADYDYQLTSIGQQNDLWVKTEMVNGVVVFAGVNDGKFSYMISAIRHDQHAEENRVVVELEKNSENTF